MTKQEEIKIGDEVYVPETLKHGIVYKISARGKVYFVDLLDVHYESYTVERCNEYTEAEKQRIIKRHRIG